jgi:polyhydroxyalkanoate synthesis regulator phasin
MPTVGRQRFNLSAADLFEEGEITLNESRRLATDILRDPSATAIHSATLAELYYW